MNSCVKTGALVLLEDYNGVAAADLHLVGTTLTAVLGSGPPRAEMHHALHYDQELRDRATHRIRLGGRGYYNKARGLVVVPLAQVQGELVLPGGRTVEAKAYAAELAAPSRPCPACGGSESIDIRHPSGDPQLETWVACGRCLGGEIDVTQAWVDRVLEAAPDTGTIDA